VPVPVPVPERATSEGRSLVDDSGRIRGGNISCEQSHTLGGPLATHARRTEATLFTTVRLR